MEKTIVETDVVAFTSLKFYNRIVTRFSGKCSKSRNAFSFWNIDPCINSFNGFSGKP